MDTGPAYRDTYHNTYTRHDKISTHILAWTYERNI